jgi:hypothetical protein
MSYLLIENFSANNIFNFPVMYDEFNVNVDEFYPGMNFIDYENIWLSMNNGMFDESTIFNTNIYFGSIMVNIEDKKSNEYVIMPIKK